MFRELSEPFTKLPSASPVSHCGDQTIKITFPASFAVTWPSSCQWGKRKVSLQRILCVGPLPLHASEYWCGLDTWRCPCHLLFSRGRLREFPAVAWSPDLVGPLTHSTKSAASRLGVIWRKINAYSFRPLSTGFLVLRTKFIITDREWEPNLALGSVAIWEVQKLGGDGGPGGGGRGCPQKMVASPWRFLSLGIIWLELCCGKIILPSRSMMD